MPYLFFPFRVTRCMFGKVSKWSVHELLFVLLKLSHGTMLLDQHPSHLHHHVQPSSARRPTIYNFKPIDELWIFKKIGSTWQDNHSSRQCEKEPMSQGSSTVVNYFAYTCTRNEDVHSTHACRLTESGFLSQFVENVGPDGGMVNSTKQRKLG
jgi:hypothetical protein